MSKSKRSVRQEDLDFCADLGFSEAEIADMRRFNNAIEYGPTACKTSEQFAALQSAARMARRTVRS